MSAKDKRKYVTLHQEKFGLNTKKTSDCKIRTEEYYMFGKSKNIFPFEYIIS
jgi:hypothetical protein